LSTIKKIIEAFYDDKCQKVWRTWVDLKQTSGLSSGALSKHIKELVRQEVVKGEVKVNEKNRLKVFYTYTEKAFHIKGKEKPSLSPCCRIYIDKKTNKKYWQWGFLKKGKGKKRYFVEDSKDPYIYSES